MEVFLVRHCQSHMDADLHQSLWPLSNRGASQAQALVPLLGDLNIDAVYSSPFRRCLDTITPFASSRQLPVNVREGLQERRICAGITDGFQAIWQRSWADFDHAEPGCESSRAAQRRIVTELATICRPAAHRAVAVSSHGNVIGLFLNNLDHRFHRRETERLRNPDVLRLVFDGGELHWDRSFCLPGLDLISTEHAATPLKRS